MPIRCWNCGGRSFCWKETVIVEHTGEPSLYWLNDKVRPDQTTRFYGWDCVDCGEFQG